MTEAKREAAHHGDERPLEYPTGEHHHSRPTQYFTLLTMLMESDEVCGSEFYKAYLPRFSVAIHLARKAGFVISKRPCDRRDHDHLGRQWLYRLEALPEMFR